MRFTQKQANLMYVALDRISNYDTPESIRQNSEEDWGVEGDEAIEMAYENVLYAAELTLKEVHRLNEEVEKRMDELALRYSKAKLKEMGGRESLRKAATQQLQLEEERNEI